MLESIQETSCVNFDKEIYIITYKNSTLQYFTLFYFI